MSPQTSVGAKSYPDLHPHQGDEHGDAPAATCLESKEVRRPHMARVVVTTRQVAVSHFLSHTACLRSSMSEDNETVAV